MPSEDVRRLVKSGQESARGVVAVKGMEINIRKKTGAGFLPIDAPNPAALASSVYRKREKRAV